MTTAEVIGDFYVHLVHGPKETDVDNNLTSSTKLLSGSNQDKPSVIHFYDGG